jgi:hypothetical protein
LFTAQPASASSTEVCTGRADVHVQWRALQAVVKAGVLDELVTLVATATDLALHSATDNAKPIPYICTAFQALLQYLQRAELRPQLSTETCASFARQVRVYAGSGVCELVPCSYMLRVSLQNKLVLHMLKIVASCTSFPDGLCSQLIELCLRSQHEMHGSRRAVTVDAANSQRCADVSTAAPRL